MRNMRRMNTMKTEGTGKVRTGNVALKLGAVGCVLAMALAGCGSAAGSYKNSMSMVDAEPAAGDAYYNEYPTYDDYSNYDDFGYEYDGEYYTQEEYDATVESSSGQSSSSAMQANQGAKLIRTVSMKMETEHFDDAVTLINQKTMEAGGYIQDSELYDYTSSERSQVITVRVPYDKVDGFLDGLDAYGTIRSKSDSTEDVTLQYSDVESHIETLETQHKRLLELMAQAENIEDIITLNREVTEVEAQLNSYKREIRNYDNLVSYSTITVSISEVSYITPAEEDTSIGGRIISGLSDNLHDMGEFFANLLVWLVINIPGFIVLAIVVVLHIVIIKLIVRGARKKRAKRLANMNEQTSQEASADEKVSEASEAVEE